MSLLMCRFSRIKRDRDGGLLDVSCNHCGKWIDASGGAHICRFRVGFKLNALAHQ
jgi:hypothetical protein